MHNINFCLYICLYIIYYFGMNKDTLINIRVNQNIKEEFQHIVEREGFTMSEVIQASMLDIVKRNALPLNIKGKIDRKARHTITIPYIKKCLENTIINMPYKTIKRVSLFGSYANGTATNKSDIDLFVETDGSLSIFDLSDLQTNLELALNKKVDLATKNDDEYFMNQIQKEMIPLYERRS